MSFRWAWRFDCSLVRRFSSCSSKDGSNGSEDSGEGSVIDLVQWVLQVNLLGQETGADLHVHVWLILPAVDNRLLAMQIEVCGERLQELALNLAAVSLSTATGVT